jgi:NAD-dependent DNA ligase
MSLKLNELSKLNKKDFLKSLKLQGIDTLKDTKRYLDDKYYNTGEKTEFTDEQYDMLKDIIVKYDKSEKKKVGSKIREDNNRVKLPYWLGSLDKIKAEEENKLVNWLKKNKAEKYVIENKLDGISCLLIFDFDKICLYTRGDGSVGANITHILKYIKNIPLTLPKSKMAIRGELIIKEKVFKEKYAKDSANPRNMVSGLVNAKSLREGIEDIEFIAYEIISDDKTQLNPMKQLKTLKDHGFKVVYHHILDVEELDIEKLSEILLENKRNSEYEIDGIIVQSNMEYVRNEKDNPKYAFAFKMSMEDNFVEAEIEEVIWNISKYKLIKPKIRIKPVNLNGVTITFASAFNAKFVVENSLGKGAKVILTRSGDVIPFIIKILKSAKTPHMPDMSYKWNDSNVDIIVEDDEEHVSDIKMISSFFSGMGIKNISDATVEKIYNHGYTNLLDIFKATKDDFEKIDGFQKKLAEKIYNNIHEGLKGISVDILLGSSGIFGEGIGKRKLKVLFENFPDILDTNLDNKVILKKICDIEGYSEKTAEKIILNLDKAKIFIKNIEPYVKFENKINKTDRLKGLSVLFSGFRNEELEKEIINNGGKISTTVSKNLNILIVKDKTSSSSKIEKAKKINIEILLMEEFIKQYL